MAGHFISRTCKGEWCGICASHCRTVEATHKVGEEIAPDDPRQARHNLTQYVCCSHFSYVMGHDCGGDSGDWERLDR